MSQFDEFLNDAARINAEIRAATAAADEAERTARIIAKCNGANAYNLALRVVAMRELRKLDPTHPLLDAAFSERMGNEAGKIFGRTRHWDVVREAAKNVKFPTRQSVRSVDELQRELTAAKAEVEALRVKSRAYASQAVASETVRMLLQRKLEEASPDHPVLAALAAVEETAASYAERNTVEDVKALASQLANPFGAPPRT